MNVLVYYVDVTYSSFAQKIEPRYNVQYVITGREQRTVGIWGSMPLAIAKPSYGLSNDASPFVILTSYTHTHIKP